MKGICERINETLRPHISETTALKSEPNMIPKTQSITERKSAQKHVIISRDLFVKQAIPMLLNNMSRMKLIIRKFGLTRTT